MSSISFTPLRSNVGRPLRITGVTLGARSPELAGFAPSLQLTAGAGTVIQADYAAFLPEAIRVGGTSTTFPPLDGVNRLPPPGYAPWDLELAPGASVRGIVPVGASTPSSRRLWMEVELRLAQPALIGGIAYAGHGLLPYTIDDHGELSSNHGLPREIRVSWRQAAPGYIDDETAITSQEASAHGGFHFLRTGPVRTDRLILRLADFPRFIHRGEYRGGRFIDVEERFGLCIPFLYVFEHREASRFSPEVPGAALAAVKYDEDGSRVAGDLLYVAQTPELRYFPLSSGSVFGQQRQYVGAGGAAMRERFSSVALGRRDRLALYVDQADENPRCLAGLNLTMATSALPGLESVTALDVGIYEVDPRQGFPVVGPAVPSDDRFATRLYRGVLATSGVHTLRFVRPTSARHLAVVFAHPEPDTPGGFFNLSVERIGFIQSAHVSVAPRPSRTQTVRALHYRLIGESLLDDYARIGDRGFALSVERVVAGERKEVLFSAATLLDLLQDGGARVLANNRFHETVEDTWTDTTTTLKGSWDDHDSYAYNQGWNRTQTGDGVSWQDPVTPPAGFRAEPPRPEDPPADHRLWASDPGRSRGFTAFGNTENRTRTQVIGQEGIWEVLEGVREILETMFPAIGWPSPPADPTGGSDLMRGRSGRGLDWHTDIWRGQHVERVGLMRNLSLPPFMAVPATALQGVSDGLRQLRDWIGNGSFPPTGPLPTLPGHLNPLFDLVGLLPILNGTNVNFSVGASYVVGANLGFSWAPILPTLGFQTSDGSQGSIAQQAQETGYNYAQHLTRGTAVGQTIHRWDREPKMMRSSERKLHEDKVKRARRRGAEIMWQGDYADVIVGKVPLGVTLPATAGRMFRTTDEQIVVRFGGTMDPKVAVDVWFDVQEEWVRDDS